MRGSEWRKRALGLALLALVVLQAIASSGYAHAQRDEGGVRRIRMKFSGLQDMNFTIVDSSPPRPYEARHRTHAEVEATNTIVISPREVNYTSARRIVRGWSITIGISQHETQVMSTTLPSESMEGTATYADLDSFLNIQFISHEHIGDMIKLTVQRFGSNTSHVLHVEYNGTSFYGGLPVLVFRVESQIRGYSYFVGNVTGKFSGHIYIYAGLPLPVRGEIDYYVESRAIGVSQAASARNVYYLVEHNLDRTVVYGHYSYGGYEIIVGGMGGSNVTAFIQANSSKMLVVNSGSSAGYVLVRKPQPIVREIFGATATYTGYEVYSVRENSSRVVDLGTVFDRNVTINATVLREPRAQAALDSTVLATIIVAIIVVAAVAVFKYSKSTGRSHK